ncbi:MAG: hypothetical protein OCC49_19390 [Fibrobacterales bacterium]
MSRRIIFLVILISTLAAASDFYTILGVQGTTFNGVKTPNASYLLGGRAGMGYYLGEWDVYRIGFGAHLNYSGYSWESYDGSETGDASVQSLGISIENDILIQDWIVTGGAGYEHVLGNSSGIIVPQFYGIEYHYGFGYRVNKNHSIHLLYTEYYFHYRPASGKDSHDGFARDLAPYGLRLQWNYRIL